MTCGRRLFCISPSLAFLEAIAVVAGLDDFASMRESIEQRGGHLGVAEHGREPPNSTSDISIKVMEPTHPLFRKTLKRLSERCGRGKAFIAVGLEDGRRRLILRSATDLDSTKRHNRSVPFVIGAITASVRAAHSKLPDGSRPGGVAGERTSVPNRYSRSASHALNLNRLRSRGERCHQKPQVGSLSRSQRSCSVFAPRAEVVLITSGEGAERVTTAHRAKLAYIYVRHNSV